MRVTVVGCSGSFSGPESASSCYLVQADADGRTWNLLLDLGSGALGALQRHLAPDTLDAVVLSHLHPDHCVDLCGLYVVRRYRPEGPLPQRLPVHGPAGTAERLSTMYHGLEPGGMESEFAFAVVRDREAFTVGPFTVTPVAVNHPVEAYGYRVEADGAVLSFTGDTDDCPALDPLLAGADLALVDAAFVDGRDHVEGIHLSGSRAGAAAARAGGVRRLVLTHLPAWNDPEVCREQAAAVWPGDVELARAGATYDLPAAPSSPGGDDATVGAGVTVDRAAGLALWAAYRAAHPHLAPEDEPAVEAFGDSTALADELIALVVDGPKRATAGLVASYAHDGDPLPRAGSHWVACDGSGRPRAVLRSTELRVGPLHSVDERFAWDEGEDDRTLASWLDGHRRYFARECERIGVPFSDDLEVCFERFRVVWPPEVADD
ncbi:MBL fold metallo-hydrolase [Oryzobacter sp. R7]|uniref:MBL fold metallo-hydrolase n=1 Tax=Oryzobacter faecalis TaxID=3388656 RepID=UPI00398D39EF